MNIFHIDQKQLYMLQNSLSCKILRVIISARVFPIQKSLCKIASLSKIRWEFLEIFSSTLWTFSANSLFLFTSICSTWFLFSSRFIEVSSCPFVLSHIFLYFLHFKFLWAFVKKSVVKFSEYGLGGREQCREKVYKQEDLQQIPFKNITLKLWSFAQSAFFFCSSELVHSSRCFTVVVNYPTVIAHILRSIVWT